MYSVTYVLGSFSCWV